MWVLLSPNQMTAPVGACGWFWLQDDHGFSTLAFPAGMLDTKGTTRFSPLCRLAVSLAGVTDGPPLEAGLGLKPSGLHLTGKRHQVRAQMLVAAPVCWAPCSVEEMLALPPASGGVLFWFSALLF